MSIKPWLQKTFLWRNRSTDIDYPPKRKKPWLSGNFAEMEQYPYLLHEMPWDPDGIRDPTGIGGDVSPPWDTPPGGPPDPGLPRPPGCAGRTLKLYSDVDCAGIEILVTGVVGSLRIESGFNLSPCTNGEDVALSGGSLAIPDDCCFNGDTIDFWYCDDCGCGYSIINIPDCENNCDPTPYVSGPGSITAPGSAQYALINSAGSILWSVSGSGATITQNGLVTVTSGACGTLVVTATDNCCGAFNKEVVISNNGYWEEIAYCDAEWGPYQNSNSCIQGSMKYGYGIIPYCGGCPDGWDWCANPCGAAYPQSLCADPPGLPIATCVTFLQTFKWSCLP